MLGQAKLKRSCSSLNLNKVYCVFIGNDVVVEHTVLVSRKMITSRMKKYDLSKCQIRWMCREILFVVEKIISRKETTLKIINPGTADKAKISWRDMNIKNYVIKMATWANSRPHIFKHGQKTHIASCKFVFELQIYWNHFCSTIHGKIRWQASADMTLFVLQFIS